MQNGNVILGLSPKTEKRVAWVSDMNRRRKEAQTPEELLEIALEYEKHHMPLLAGACRKQAAKMRRIESHYP
jgi:hypothetical protein